MDGQSRDADDEATTLLRLAVRLRQAAVDTGRADVVSKVDEVIVLVAGNRVVDKGSSQSTGSDGKGASIIKFLDGLGF